ncbi:S9 family peptidase [Actinoplanes sp. NPDC051346]|uniref:S9 family peptidase n=1 Tax=Actinoplanes sp. NPDC051346 TaxID=3155048 RepID=UPI0034361E2C
MLAYPDFQPDLRFLPTLAVSPDGGSVAYVDDATGQFNLTIQSIDGGGTRRLTSYADTTVRHVAWHPAGDNLIFTADAKGNESTQLHQISLHGGEPLALTESSKTQYVLARGNPFSPDGKYLAYAGNDRVPQDQDVLVRDMASGAVQRIYAGGGRVHAGHWSPDGDRLTVVEWRTTNSDHLVHVVPLDGGPPVLLTPKDEAHCYWIGPWLPDGRGFLVLTNAGREFNGLAVMDATTGDLSWLDTPDWDVDEVAMSQDGSVIAWNVRVDGVAQLRARDMTSGEDLDLPALPMGSATGLTLSPDGRFAALRLSTATRPWNVAVMDLTTGSVRWLTDSKPVRADRTTFIEPTLAHYPTRDGQRVPAFLYRPVNSARPAGVLISVHGGPNWQEIPAYLYDGFYQYLLSHDIAVFAPNVRGSTGYGMSYQTRIFRDWGGVDLDDFADAVAFLRDENWIDGDRIGIFGASYGGFAVLSCLSRLPELNWAAGVDFYGPSNLVTLAKASPPTWKTLVETMFGDPDADAAELLARSPVTYADQIRAPLMVVQGANDPRVPRSESEQMLERLRTHGVEVDYELFTDEGHGFTKRDNQAKAFSAAGEFLIRHLAPSDT